MKRRAPFGFSLGGACATGFGEEAPQCRPGARNARALSILRQQKYSRPSNLRGGILAWAGQVDPSLRY